MAPPIIAFPNRIDVATLSGGAWLPALPLANLKDRVIRKVARAINLLPASTQFTVTLDRPRNIRVVALVGHNLSEDARIRWTAKLGTDVVHQTAWTDAYPAIHSTALLDWEDPNWWSGRPTSEDLAGLNQVALLVLPQQVHAGAWTVEIDDPGNPAGYVQIGRAFLAAHWQPSLAPEYGQASISVETATTLETALGGTEYADRRPTYRVVRLGFPYLPEVEAHTRAFDLMRQAGVDGEVLVVSDPDDLPNLQRRSFLGRLRTLNPIEQAVYGRGGVQFEIKESL